MPPPPPDREPQDAMQISQLAETLSFQKRLDAAFRRIEELERATEFHTYTFARMADENTADREDWQRVLCNDHRFLRDLRNTGVEKGRRGWAILYQLVGPA